MNMPPTPNRPPYPYPNPQPSPLPYPYPYPAYPYGPYAPYAPAVPVVQVVPVAPPHVTSEEGPAPEAPRGLFPGRYAAIFGVAMVVFALAAIVLAALAPALDGNQSSYVPSGWSAEFDGTPTPARQWDDRHGCTIANGALHADPSVTGGGICLYQPSETHDLVSGGVYIQATVAPAASVAGSEVAAIYLGTSGNRIAALVEQSGVYAVCTDACDSSAAVYATGETIAWHADGYTENVIALRYLPGTQALTLYVNGQEVQTVIYQMPANSFIALGTTRDSEALFTRMSIYSGPAS